MKIALFGSTGRVGKEFLNFVISDGYQVKALVRSPEKIEFNSALLELHKGNAREFHDVLPTIEDCDLVVSALNTDSDDTLSVSILHIIKAMQEQRVQRIITIGTAGILQSRTDPSIYRFQSSESKQRSTRAAEEHLKMYEALKESNLDWTIICPTYLPDGILTKNYRYEVTFLPFEGKSISVQDTAHFAFSQLILSKFNRQRVGLSY
ncbi:NAD(P)-dependent oxidoreductase [Metabacillus herbersteinensis]|uniref:NAD(P)-dependent oxidoreductase n=1 Tax=Metabacillus herbersteinensis TaxID=283816 RepID=A0ABV6GEK7_9BACI